MIEKRLVEHKFICIKELHPLYSFSPNSNISEHKSSDETILHPPESLWLLVTHHTSGLDTHILKCDAPNVSWFPLMSFFQPWSSTLEFSKCINIQNILFTLHKNLKMLFRRPGILYHNVSECEGVSPLSPALTPHVEQGPSSPMVPVSSGIDNCTVLNN